MVSTTCDVCEGDLTQERMEACMKAKFPLCLDEALQEKLGPNAKLTLDLLIMSELTKEDPASPEDIWQLYKEYIESSAKIMGVRVSQIFRYTSLKEMESMLCTSCPLYLKEREIRKYQSRNL